ncbi:hypothetical protein CI610_01969 [invertebrate metagenome]|uniref:STAS domain-containing protein n=1 Tax=invertebrate metagenome TaxID=1711999 RepID=A0A2H9T761_9ZZZZ
MGSYCLNHRGDNCYEWVLEGDWRTGKVVSSDFLDPLYESKPIRLCFVAGHDFQWNSQLIAALFQCIKQCTARSCKVNISGLPDDIQRLISLAATVPDTVSTSVNKGSFLIRCNKWISNTFRKIKSVLSFIRRHCAGFDNS